jgi:O-antigen/teichoic acid export membrane protein
MSVLNIQHVSPGTRLFIFMVAVALGVLFFAWSSYIHVDISSGMRFVPRVVSSVLICCLIASVIVIFFLGWSLIEKKNEYFLFFICLVMIMGIGAVAITDYPNRQEKEGMGIGLRLSQNLLDKKTSVPQSR